MIYLLLLWAFSALAQMGLLAALWCCDLARFGRTADKGEMADPPPYPLVSLIIPCSGASEEMEAALLSLLRQDYPALAVLLVTSGRTDPARQLAAKIVAGHPCALHVEARPAESCGQKNRNLLDALARADEKTAVYAFCDANHLAKPDFIRQLTKPVRLGLEPVCSGYRATRLAAFDPAAVACHILVWHMGLLQSLPWFTQPWGGAFAIDAASFRKFGLLDLWARTVVDDVSLAGLLMRSGRRAHYCRQAILDSPIGELSESRLRDWFFRQLFYPRFYTFSVWLLLGAGILWFSATALAGLGLTIAWAAGAGPAFSFVPLALAHLALPSVLRGVLRRRLAPDCPPGVWRQGLGLALKTLVACYCRTVFSRSLVWRGIRYHLDSSGRVTRVNRPQ